MNPYTNYFHLYCYSKGSYSVTCPPPCCEVQGPRGINLGHLVLACVLTMLFCFLSKVFLHEELQAVCTLHTVPCHLLIPGSVVG